MLLNRIRYRTIQRIFLTVLLLVLPAGVVFAQNTRKDGKWGGDFKLNVGSNFSTAVTNKKSNNTGSASARMSYSSAKFDLSFNASGSYDYHFAGGAGMDTDISGQDTTSVVDASANEIRNMFISGGLTGAWRPDKVNTFSFSYSYGFDRSTPTYYVFTDGWAVDSVLTTKGSKKDVKNTVNTHTANILYSRDFAKPGRKLTANANLFHNTSATYAEWLVGHGDIDMKGRIELGHETLFMENTTVIERHFRETPSQRESEAGIKVVYYDKDFCKVENLNVSFALLADLRALEDHRSCATYIDDDWKDSVSVRENFLYRTISVTPQVQASYGIKWYKVDFSFAPERFLRRLDSDGKTGDFNRGEIAQDLLLNNTFKLKGGSKFFLNAARNESRPSYLQICWFPRQSVQYSDELYVGNPDLHNTVTNKVLGGFTFSGKTPFSSEISVLFTNKSDRIEQIYSKETVAGKECRVYTWVNGGNSNELTGTLSLFWKGERFNTALKGKYNMFRGVNVSEKVTRSADYSVRAEFGYNWKTWDFASDITYQSDVIRDYNAMKSIAECNARVSKSFGRLIISLDGKNLLDRPLELFTVSADGTEMRREIYKNNKRIIILGLTYSF